MTDSVDKPKRVRRSKAELERRAKELEASKIRTENRLRQSYKYKPEYAEKLIEHMARGLSYESFAGACRVTQKTLYNWEQKHEEFAKAKELAVAANRAFWERVGMEGMTGEFEKFNSAIWIFNMKNRFGWTDKRETKTEHTVTLESIIGSSFEEPRQVENEHKEETNELEHDRDDEDPLA